MKSYINLLTTGNKNNILFFIFLNITLVFAETISIALIPLFIDYIINPNPLLPNYLNFSNEFTKNLSQLDLINYGIIFFITIFIFKNILYLSVIIFQATLKKKFNYYLKKKFLNLYIFAPFEIIKKYNTSEILRNTDTEAQNYVTNFFDILRFSKDILLFLCLFLLLIVVDLYSTLVTLFILGICVFFYILTFFKFLNKIGKERLSAVTAVYKWIHQTCGAIKEIKISRKENAVLENFSNRVNLHENSKKMTEIIGALPIAIFEMVFVIVILILIKFVATSGSINALPALSLYVLAFIRLLPIVSRFGTTISGLRSFSPSVKLLNNEINKLEKFIKIKDYNLNEKINILPFKKDLLVDNISFKYGDGQENIFENFNFKIKKGKSYAFLGKSGSGKTTLINLICGLLKPTEGELIVDGNKVSQNIIGWQKNIGLISQENYLIDDTLENNIVFLNNKNVIDEKKLNNAISYSGVLDFSKKLKNGLKTEIGERGSKLSGGQIQRVALARLLYKDPEVFILDEFTNSLDIENEDYILDKLKLIQREKGKTLIIISHKLKPLKICDEIIILDKGKMSEKYNYSDFYEKYHLLYD